MSLCELNEKMKLIIIGFLLTIIFDASGQRYDYLVDSIFITSTQEKTPGFSIMVIQNDSIVAQQSFGYSNVKKKIELDQNSRIAIASCSKQFTAYCILLLEKDKKISLSDDIRKYIPELPEYSSIIQIRHLLSHTSGIRDHIEMLGWSRNQKDKYYNFDGILEALNKYDGLSYKPGENFSYSNTGYMLLALIVERVSGMRFEEFVKQQIFAPLGMSSTEFSFRRKYEEYGEVNPYSYNFKTGKYKEFRHLEVNAIGATGIYTTISDYAQWDKHLTNPPDYREDIIEKLFTTDTLNNGKSVNYNFGFKHRTYKGYKIVEHSGGWANYNFQYTRIPELKISIIVGSNNENHYPIGMAEELLKNIIPEDRILNRTDTSTLNIPSTFLTKYVCTDFSSIQLIKCNNEFIIEGESLYGGKKYPLLCTNFGVQMDSVGNTIVFNSLDTSFLWYGGSYFNYPRLFTTNQPIETKKLPNYSGIYYSGELGIVKVKYNRISGSFKLRTSYGPNPRILFIDNRFIKTNRNYNLLLVDENTLLLGNSRGCVKFEKKL